MNYIYDTDVPTVEFVSSFIAPEWIAAHGLRPSRVLLSRQPVRSTPPVGACPYAWYYMDRPTHADAVLFSTECDQMQRIHEQFKNG